MLYGIDTPRRSCRSKWTPVIYFNVAGPFTSEDVAEVQPAREGREASVSDAEPKSTAAQS